MADALLPLLTAELPLPTCLFFPLLFGSLCIFNCCSSLSRGLFLSFSALADSQSIFPTLHLLLCLKWPCVQPVSEDYQGARRPAHRAPHEQTYNKQPDDVGHKEEQIRHQRGFGRWCHIGGHARWGVGPKTIMDARQKKDPNKHGYSVNNLRMQP